MNFIPNDQDLTFFAQGVELSKITSAVVAANNLGNDPTKNKVILVAHSMGGLAARAYIQNQAMTMDGQHVDYNGDVQQLIAVATPNQGSMFAQLCELMPGPLGCKLSGYNPESVALQSLIPGTSALISLNAAATSLPHQEGEQYVSIVVNWIPTLTGITRNWLAVTLYSYTYDDDGDGIVTQTSQDLSKVVPNANPSIFPSDSLIFTADSNCANRNGLAGFTQIIKEVHTCETQNQKIWDKILSHISGVGAVVWTGAPSITQTTLSLAL